MNPTVAPIPAPFITKVLGDCLVQVVCRDCGGTGRDCESLISNIDLGPCDYCEGSGQQVLMFWWQA